MGKINLIDQLRKRGSGGNTSSSFAAKSADVEFEDVAVGSDSDGLDAYEKRKVLMLLIGVGLVLGGRQLVPLYTQDMESAARSEAASVDQEIAGQQKKAQDLQVVQEEMRQYDGRVADLKAKLQKVKQLDEDRNLLVRMTDYIVKEMPQRLWFDRIDIDTRTRVSISGYSSNYQIVSDFMKKLEGAVYFPQWRLVQTENQVSTSSAPTPSSVPGNDIIVPPDSKKFELEAETAKL